MANPKHHLDSGEPMDFNAHVSAILRSPRIKGKIVVLCEGEYAASPDRDVAPSPQTYRRHERLPDASFYRNCIPRSWHNHKIPCFFNCGDRVSVLRTFDELGKRHAADPDESFLDPDKLYAMVDLDVQASPLPNGYPESDTEALHESLYEKCRLKSQLAPRHRIWVTAMIHKEAYFFLPPANKRVLEHRISPSFDGGPLTMERLCGSAIERIRPGHAQSDQDLVTHFPKVVNRLTPFRGQFGLDLSDHDAFSASIDRAHSSMSFDDARCIDLVYTLFLVTKAKPLWKQIVPETDSGWTRSDDEYRQELALLVADGVARLEGTDHLLAAFIDVLKTRR